VFCGSFRLYRSIQIQRPTVLSVTAEAILDPTGCCESPRVAGVNRYLSVWSSTLDRAPIRICLSGGWKVASLHLEDEARAQPLRRRPSCRSRSVFSVPATPSPPWMRTTRQRNPHPNCQLIYKTRIVAQQRHKGVGLWALSLLKTTIRIAWDRIRSRRVKMSVGEGLWNESCVTRFQS